MQQIRTQPAGPKAFRLYATVRDAHGHELGDHTFAVYAALTYYVHPKTLQGAIPLKLLAQTIHRHPSTISRHLQKLGQLGLITITPQWDAFGCVRDVNVYRLDTRPHRAMSLWRLRTAAIVTRCPGRRHTEATAAGARRTAARRSPGSDAARQSARGNVEACSGVEQSDGDGAMAHSGAL